MTNYLVKKVLPVDNNLSLEECEKILVSGDYCLGILDANRDITGFVTREDLLRALKFSINNCSIDLIGTLAEVIDIDIENINEDEISKYIEPGLNKGVFVGKNKKEVSHLILCSDQCKQSEQRFLTQEYEKNVPDKIKKALELCYKAADKISLPIYLIGGIVRDIITERESFDVDITVQENAIEFSRFLRKEYPTICKIKEVHEDFKTAKVTFNIDGENVDLDIASTRKETYKYPASLPTVEQIGCNIYDDLVRRDFTINSMALSLNQSNFCELIDPLNGYRDIQEKRIKILHPISFVDDPTRMIRALKFAVRFECEFDRATEKLKETCINSGLFDGLAGERIKSEIKQTFNLNKSECLSEFIRQNLYRLINREIFVPQDREILSKKSQLLITRYKKFLESSDLIWLVYLGVLIVDSSIDVINEIAEKLYLSGLETEILIGGKSILSNVEFIKEAKTRFDIYEQLEGFFSESVIIAMTKVEDETALRNIDLYLRELQNIKIYTTGKNLIDAGLIPGPVFGEILRELLRAKINQEILTQEDERAYIKRFVSLKSRN